MTACRHNSFLRLRLVNCTLTDAGAVWRMRHSSNTPLEGGRTDMPAPQQGASGSTMNGGAEAALATCCRAIAGMLRGMAEVEAQGLMAPQAR